MPGNYYFNTYDCELCKEDFTKVSDQQDKWFLRTV